MSLDSLPTGSSLLLDTSPTLTGGANDNEHREASRAEMRRFLKQYGFDVEELLAQRPFKWERTAGGPEEKIDNFVVDPYIAAQIISTNPGNPRGVIGNAGFSYVSMLADDMLNGRWIPNFRQGIAFNSRREHVAGAQRMMAIIVSGCTIPFHATFNEPVGYDEIAGDQGRPRSQTAVLRSLGLQNLSDAKVATAKRIQLSNIERIPKFSQTKLTELVERHREMVEYAHSAIPKGKNIATAGPRGAWARAAYAHPHERDRLLKRFAHTLVTGVTSTEDDPAIKLRLKLQSNDMKGNSNLDFLRYQYTELAIVAYLNGDTITKWNQGNGVWKGECFPLPTTKQ